jgi:hypothetical protein
MNKLSFDGSGALTEESLLSIGYARELSSGQNVCGGCCFEHFGSCKKMPPCIEHKWSNPRKLNTDIILNIINIMSTHPSIT